MRTMFGILDRYCLQSGLGKIWPNSVARHWGIIEQLGVVSLVLAISSLVYLGSLLAG